MNQLDKSTKESSELQNQLGKLTKERKELKSEASMSTKRKSSELKNQLDQFHNGEQ